MLERQPTRGDEDCWEGRGDDTHYVAGRPDVLPAADNLPELFDAMACCTRCDLARARTRVVPGVGAPDARVMLVGEAPGGSEDRAGRPFVGRAGKLLDQLLAEQALSREDVYITNVVACRPPKNRNPRVREVRAHSPWLRQQIRIVAPDVIVALGRVALTYFVPKARITELHGESASIEVDDQRVDLLPLYHPAAALRRRDLLPDLRAGFAKLPALLGRAAGRG